MALLAVAGLAGCLGSEQPADQPLETSLYALVETMDGVALYPPLGPEVTAATRAIDTSLLAGMSVVLESTDASGHVATVATFDTSTRPALALYASFGVYFVNVPAAAYFTNPALAYRFRVLWSGTELARSDLSSRVFDVLATNPGLLVGVKVRVEQRPAPALTAIAPASGAREAGATLTLSGSGFLRESVATFAGAPVATTVLSGTSLLATVPASAVAAAGEYAVGVSTPAPGGGTSGTATYTAYNAQPVLTSVTPAVVTAGSGATTLTLDGGAFTAGAEVTFAGAALVTTFVSATRLTAVVPAALLATGGAYDLSVANPAPSYGASGTLSVTVSWAAPVLTSLAPASVTAGGAALTLTVNGTGFVSGAEVSFGGVALPTTFVSATRLTALVPATSVATGGTRTVTVTNPAPSAGASLGLTFTVNNPAPTIALLTPSSIAAGAAAFTLTVDGASFQPSSTVSFGGASLVTTHVSATRLTAAVPASAVASWGTASVTVTTPSPAGGTSAAATFTITARINDGLIAQYDFEETSGAVIDHSGNGNNLTLNGATRLAAGFGASPTSRGLACSGGQTATAPSSASLRSPRDQLTIAGWIKPTVTTGDPGVVAMGARGGSSQAWGFYIRSGAELGIFTNFPSRSSSVYDSTTSGANIRANEWVHVAVVIDYPARQARYYKNGALIYTAAHNTPLDQLTVPLTFCSEAGAIQDFSGQLDDFSIWGRALSSDEVATVARQLTGQSATVLGSGTTCASILGSGGSRGDGLYALDPDGLGGVAPMITYCDMTTDGGGWTLVGNQVGSAQISSVTADDINPQNDGSRTSTFRFGNTRIQAFSPTVGWRMRALNSSNVVTDLGYLRPQCVVNWLRMVGIRTSDCNAVAGVTLVSSLDTNCGVLYTSTAFTTLVSNYTTANCALGIGQNNSGGFCSMRFSSVGWGTVPVGAALPCDVSRTSAVTMQLWVK